MVNPMKTLIRNVLRFVAAVKPLRALLRVIYRAGFLPVKLIRRLPVEDIISVPINGRETFLYYSSYGDQIGRSLYWEGAGGFEPETFKFFDGLIRQSSVFADVGANTGHFALYACAVNPRVKVRAFEPVPRTFLRLKENVELNGWTERCDVYNKAVGGVSGHVQFHIPFDELPTSASLHSRGFNEIPGELVETEVVCLDSFYSADVPLDLLKIDVEGFEHNVLEGLKGFFDSGFRPKIILECNLGGPEDELNALLKPLGYHFYNLLEAGPVRADLIHAHPEHAFRNWAVLPDAL